ncbi:AAA family ATPase [Lacticaseibacillus hegangensis]|uniref:AAA family ATPase n=1 Tax=Lacticaseibacillus hegangensis TaxID=2486010 RepID=A0ABW4CX56_9LACO|nr:AAA family ATPase [Lacticaseibacillus hegangensis]
MRKQSKLPRQYDTEVLSQSQRMSALTAKLLQIQKQTGIKALAVLSATQYDGKTAVTSSLAINYANSGRKVLLINANPFDEVSALGGGSKGGLSDFLTKEKAELADFISKTQYEGLETISGNQNALVFNNVSARASIDRLLQTVNDEYDLILFDGPATDEGPDGLALADLIKTVLVVLRRDHSKISAVDTMMSDLIDTGANVIGSIVIDQ